MKKQNLQVVILRTKKSPRVRRYYPRYYLSLVLLAMTMACNRGAILEPIKTDSPIPSTPVAVPTSVPLDLPLRFHVEGNAFVDQKGKPMVFRGMSAIDPVYQRFNDSSKFGLWSEQYYQEMSLWCANIVRLPILPSSLRDNGIEKSIDTLDQTIAWAAKNKLYVIIDFHSLGWPPEDYYPPNSPWYSTTTQEMIDFWDTISIRYANNNTVAFYEVFNEPVTKSSYKDYSGASATLEDWLVWKEFMEQIIAVIRANDPDKIILVGGLQFAYDLSFVADNPIAGDNIAFTTHPYSHPKWQKDWKTAFGDLSSKYPIFATEFGYESQDDFYNGVPYHQAIVDYLEEQKISWAAWTFNATWEPALLLNNNTFQPSLAGEFFRGKMKNLNKCP